MNGTSLIITLRHTFYRSSEEITLSFGAEMGPFNKQQQFLVVNNEICVEVGVTIRADRDPISTGLS